VCSLNTDRIFERKLKNVKAREERRERVVIIGQTSKLDGKEVRQK
jgi:hypothetical protein